MFPNINLQLIKTLKKLIQWLLGVILGMYIGVIILLNIPFVQQKTAAYVSHQLSILLNTSVSVEKINLGLLNRIVVDNIALKDQSATDLLKVTRLSAKFEILPLLNGKISINSIQLFGFNISLNKANRNSKANYQFIIDALTPTNKTSKKNNNLDLRINSILIRRGKLSYDILSESTTPGKFNPSHIKLHNIIANISLKSLHNDSINASIKRLSLDEQSGLSLRKLTLKVLANDKKMTVENFKLELANTQIKTNQIEMSYNSFEDFNDFGNKVNFALSILPSRITFKDISPIVTSLAHFKESIELEMKLKGTINQLDIPFLSIKGSEHLKLNSSLSFQYLLDPENTYLYGKLDNLFIDSKGFDFITRNMSDTYLGIKPILNRLGNISFSGEVSGYYSDLVTYGLFKTDLGSFNTDLKLSGNKETHALSYSGEIKTIDFSLGKLINNSLVGQTSLNFIVNGYHPKMQYPTINIKGLISKIEYKQYKYENINLDGEYKAGGYNGKIALNDPNGNVLLKGEFNPYNKIPNFNFTALISKIKPHNLNLSSKYSETEFSLNINANFHGKSINDLSGEVSVDSFICKSATKDFYIPEIKISASNEDKNKKIKINSSFIKGTILGQYSYETIGNSITNILKKHLSSLASSTTNSQEKKSENNFNFDIHVYNTDILPILLDIPLNINSHSTIKGYVDDKMSRTRLEAYFPKLKYDNFNIESGVLICDNQGDQISAQIRFTNIRDNKNAINFSLDSKAKNDTLYTTLNWGNNSKNTYGGKLSAVTKFTRKINEVSQESNIATQIEIKATDVILNDTLWKIHPSIIKLESQKIEINNFYFSHKNQYIHINGSASKNESDTLKMQLRDINIDYVFDVVNLQGLDFKGKASGNAYITKTMKTPTMRANLSVKQFRFNNGIIGDMNITGNWDEKNEGILLDAKIQEPNKSKTTVSGYIYPLKPKSGLDLYINAQNTNLKFMEHYVQSIISDIKGKGSGNVHLFGTFKALNIEGKVKPDATLKINLLNTYFAVKDSIEMKADQFSFNNIPISDLEGHNGSLNGTIKHQNFKNMHYNLEFKANNLLVMNTKENNGAPFYGTIYATGNALLNGNPEGLNIDAALVTNKNSHFVYIAGGIASATNNQFIKFIDKTPKRSVDIVDETIENPIDKSPTDTSTDVRLNISVDATPDATMKIVMDPIAGDYISGKGFGNIRTEYYNKGDIKMFGNYQINQGVYKFSLQEIIRKDFTIQNGSEISFNGNPLDANLNIQAIYTVNSASLNDLLPDASQIVQQPNVKVNCNMFLSGALIKPTIKMEIKLPNENDEVQTLVRNYINSDEQTNMQILYLLSIGKFYTAENVNSAQSSNVMPSVLASTLSGQLNNMLSQILNYSNWNIGTNLSTGDKGWTDLEVEGLLSGQLLNNRLLINGNFGYRDNPMANTNFIGDFQAEWLLTRSGDIRLKAYNETNDKYYTRTNLTTQGFGIMYKKDFNKWNELFFWQNWIKRVKSKNKQQ